MTGDNRGRWSTTAHKSGRRLSGKNPILFRCRVARGNSPILVSGSSKCRSGVTRCLALNQPSSFTRGQPRIGTEKLTDLNFHQMLGLQSVEEPLRNRWDRFHDLTIPFSKAGSFFDRRTRRQTRSELGLQRCKRADRSIPPLGGSPSINDQFHDRQDRCTYREPGDPCRPSCSDSKNLELLFCPCESKTRS
ncbi:MAG: hypothetical protein QG608_3883 [Actinomycetota bacterium]|nr:hypothetical protein [Actinomycetota bacterium]